MKIFFISISFSLFKLWLFFFFNFFCGQTFLVVLQRHNFLCDKKKNFHSGIFNMPVFLNLAEGNDLGLDKGIPSLF